LDFQEIVYTVRWKLAKERTPCKLRLPIPSHKEAAPWTRYPKVVLLSMPRLSLMLPWTRQCKL
jgi:hypothetical protein